MRAWAGSCVIMAVAAACSSFGAANDGESEELPADAGVQPSGDAGRDASGTTVFSTSFEEAFPFGFTETSEAFGPKLGEGIDGKNALELRAGDESKDPRFLKWRSGRVSPSAWTANLQLRVQATPSEGADANLLRVECGGTSNIDLKLKPNRKLQLQFHGGESSISEREVPDQKWVGIQLAWNAAEAKVTLVRDDDTTPVERPAAVTCNSAQLAVYLGFVSWNSTPENEYAVLLDAFSIEVR